jgi:hypothetical protein
MDDFCLIDLVSQREAVREHLKGRSTAEIVRRLAGRGRLDRDTFAGREAFFFESAAGLRAAFLFDGDALVFVGDHTTFI